MITLLLSFALSLSGEKIQEEARLTADFDGQGAEQTATAVVKGARVRLEIRDARGRLLAKTAAPAPAARNAAVTLAAGSLGSAGTLLEVAVTAESSECRSIWRYREGRLMMAPLAVESGTLPECANREWASRWERPAGDAPALYVRERSRERSNGTLRELEVFRYTGFRLTIDRGRSSVSINDVEIPSWRAFTLYPRPALDSLGSRFDLSQLRTGPRLRLVADRGEGTFEIAVDDGPKRQTRAVTAVSRTENPRERILTVGAGGARVRVLLDANGLAPVEANLQGLEPRLDRTYVATSRVNGSRFQYYESAEQELAQEYLPGRWDAGKEQVAARPVPSSPAVVRLGSAEFSLRISDAPSGTDALLVPRDGTLPAAGIKLRGENSFLETLLRCKRPEAPGAFACEMLGPGRTFRRIGARLNQH